MRFAVPLEGPSCRPTQRASIDDVRAMVDHVHAVLDVKFPADDYYMNLLGTGRLAGKIPKAWEKRGLAGPVVILGCYKIRQPHTDALWQHVGPQTKNPTVKRLAFWTTEIGDRSVEDCTDVLVEEIRGGTFHGFSTDFAGTPREHYDTLVQEHRAWAHIGATRYDASGEIANAEKDIREMEEKHGAADPSQWSWGAGTPCADVFEADGAKQRHEDLCAKIAALKELRDEWLAVDTRPASGTDVAAPPPNAAGDALTSGHEEVGRRSRSRSPRQLRDAGSQV